jgi:hypothetical protein
MEKSEVPGGLRRINWGIALEFPEGCDGSEDKIFQLLVPASPLRVSLYPQVEGDLVGENFGELLFRAEADFTDHAALFANYHSLL